MVKLNFGIEFAGNKNWHGCIAKPDCEVPRPSAWSHSPLHTIVTDSLRQTIPAEALDYLSTRVLAGDDMSTLLATQSDKQLSAKETARVFLLHHTDVWQPWVSAEVADKVIDSLATLH